MPFNWLVLTKNNSFKKKSQNVPIKQPNVSGEIPLYQWKLEIKKRNKSYCFVDHVLGVKINLELKANEKY